MSRHDSRGQQTGENREKFEKYLAQGMEDTDAKEKAHWKTTPEIKTEFLDNCKTHQREYKILEFNNVHRDILHTMEKRLTDSLEIRQAAKTGSG